MGCHLSEDPDAHMVFRCAIPILSRISVIDAIDEASDESDADGADSSFDGHVSITS